MRFLRTILVFCFAFGLIGAVHAQKKKVKTTEPVFSPETLQKLQGAEDTLAILAFAVVNDSLEIERFTACRALIAYLVQTLKTPNSFHYRFERLKSISILAPPDSSFRIFSWQLFVNDSTYRYYGAIQMNTPELKLFPLIDRSFEMEEEAAGEQLPPERWYGALYYNIMPLETSREKQYLLFGYDAFSFFEKRKVLDVVRFDEKGQPIFGAAIFNRGTPDAEMRMILQYSAEAPIKMNWDEQYQMILFDHLIAIPNPFKSGLIMAPDGSYDGFRIEKGRLVYVDKVFNDVNPEVPMPEPILEERANKNILGKKKKS